MSNIIDSIQVSGVTYTIQGSGGGGNPTVELTQAEYNALVESGAVQTNTYYIITDAQAGDLTQYWTSAQTNSAITAAVSGKQDTLSAGTNITISGNVISAEGGGKAISAGTNISVTTGETTDTVSCTLPIRTDGTYAAKGLVLGSGNGMHAKGALSIVGGDWVSASTNAHYSFAVGSWINASNEKEFVCGGYNITRRASSTFGDSGNTLFSVGNGTADNARHNAFEIRQNGDIYLNDGTNDVRLQDTILALGGLKLKQVTQAEYDALVSGGTVDANTLYIITNVVS